MHVDDVDDEVSDLILRVSRIFIVRAGSGSFPGGVLGTVRSEHVWQRSISENLVGTSLPMGASNVCEHIFLFIPSYISSKSALACQVDYEQTAGCPVYFLLCREAYIVPRSLLSVIYVLSLCVPYG